MTFAFDLISDLHIETWDQDFRWDGQPTSPYCIVAGDISRNRNTLLEVLKHLGDCYQAVFYVDGNDEHVEAWDNLESSYHDLADRIRPLHNVVYLQDNVIIINGVAILGTNGWWGFDFGDIDPTDAARWYQSKWPGEVTGQVLQNIGYQCTNDAVYMAHSIRRLQTHSQVRRIVVVTHTVPMPELIQHDIDLSGTYRFNCMGNTGMAAAMDADTERKIHTWCFGHYHMPVDQVRDGVRFVNNCRGRGDSPYRQWAYQPRRIEIEV